MVRDNTEQREMANIAVRGWVGQNKKAYNHFLRQIDGIGRGDFSILEQIMSLLNECMPQSARDFYGYIFGYLTHPEQAEDDGKAFSAYDQLAAQCITGNAMIKVDLTTGQVARTRQTQSDSIIIRTDDFEKAIMSMPHSMMGVVNEQILFLMMEQGTIATQPSGYDALKDLAMLVAKTLYVYSLLFVPDYLENLQQKISGDSQPLAYCIYHFITFDHGLAKMAKAFSRQMVTDYSNSFTEEMFRLCIKTFVQNSLLTGTETKAKWLQVANSIGNEDAWKEIQYEVSQCKTKGGQHKDLRTIDELLVGNKESLKRKIQDFLKRNTSPCCLAYLLYVLRETGHIKHCDYITFHRSLQKMTDKPIGGPDVPQRRFNEIMAEPKLLKENMPKWKHARQVVNELMAEFHTSG